MAEQECQGGKDNEGEDGDEAVVLPPFDDVVTAFGRTSARFQAVLSWPP